MKKVMRILSFLSLFLCCGFIASAQWVPFLESTGRFRVLAPGTMTEKISKIKTGLGDLEYHTFSYHPVEAKPDNEFYVVNYCDYPKGVFPKDSIDLIKEFMDATVETSIKSVHGSLTYQDDIKQNGFVGKIWRVSYNRDRASIKSKCFLAGDRFYLVQTMTTKEHSLNPLEDKFLDSFGINE